MAKLHQQYKLTLTTLTPLHIGTGRTLMRGFDYVTHGRRTWVLDDRVLAERLLESAPDDFQRMMMGRPADEFIDPGEYQAANNALFRYVMDGEPKARAHGSQVQEQIKDTNDRPFIPGSSLKGALRTAILFGLWSEKQKIFDEGALSSLNPRSSKYAADALEKQSLGKNPNYDLLRALQVTDSSTAPADTLRLVNISVLAGSKSGAPVEIEAVNEGVTFEARLSLDGFLLRDEIRRQLDWDETQHKMLKRLVRVINFWTETRLAEDDWRTVSGPWKQRMNSLVLMFQGLEKNECIFQLGWGGGWDSKTLGAHLTQNQAMFHSMVMKYQRDMDRQKSFKKGDHFPKSRRVVIGPQGQPLYTLGWVKMKMERIEA